MQCYIFYVISQVIISKVFTSIVALSLVSTIVITVLLSMHSATINSGFIDSLVGIGDQSYKTFYGRNIRIFLISQSVCPFKPILTFAGKAGAYTSEAPFRCCSTQGQTSGLTHIRQSRLERLAMDEYPSLLRKSVNYVLKKVLQHWPHCVGTHNTQFSS